MLFLQWFCPCIQIRSCFFDNEYAISLREIAIDTLHSRRLTLASERRQEAGLDHSHKAAKADQMKTFQEAHGR
jgi:hypothetical protein